MVHKIQHRRKLEGGFTIYLCYCSPQYIKIVNLQNIDFAMVSNEPSPKNNLKGYLAKYKHPWLFQFKHRKLSIFIIPNYKITFTNLNCAYFQPSKSKTTSEYEMPLLFCIFLPLLFSVQHLKSQRLPKNHLRHKRDSSYFITNRCNSWVQSRTDHGSLVFSTVFWNLQIQKPPGSRYKL